MGAITDAAEHPLGVPSSPFEACDELVLTYPESRPIKRRDYAAERAAAKHRKVSEILAVRHLRDENVLGQNMFQMSQAFIACSVMRYKPTTERQISHSARMADHTLTVALTAGVPGIALPFGTDRTLLYWLFDQAVKSKSPFIPLDKIAPYLAEMGMVDSGKNYSDLLARLERLYGMVITVQRSNEDVVEVEMLRVFNKSRMPKGSRFHGKYKPSAVPEEYRGKVGMLISPEVFADLMKFHVVVPIEVIRLHRDKPRMLDMALFLYWRCYAAQGESKITWDSLAEQMGHPDNNPRRLRETANAGCEMWKSIWPEFDCGCSVDFLWIRPPRKGRYLTAEGQNARNLVLPYE